MAIDHAVGPHGHRVGSEVRSVVREHSGKRGWVAGVLFSRPIGYPLCLCGGQRPRWIIWLVNLHEIPLFITAHERSSQVRDPSMEARRAGLDEGRHDPGQPFRYSESVPLTLIDLSAAFRSDLTLRTIRGLSGVSGEQWGRGRHLARRIPSRRPRLSRP